MLSARTLRRGRRAAERGDILLVSMVFLLLCLLLLVSSMRDTINNTNQAGSTLVRQKLPQVADVATQNIRNQIMTLAPAGLPLTSASGIISQNWWRDEPPTSAATPPTAAYWQTCSLSPNVSGTTTRCGVVTLGVGGTEYTALAVVQPTGRSDPNTTQCGINGLAQSVYYAIFIHVQESNSATYVNTESVYQACEQKQ